MANYKDLSRENYGISDNDTPTFEQVQLGCLQRIANASEAIAKKYVQMEVNLTWYKNKYKENVEEIKLLKNRIRGIKARITRDKKHGNN